MAKNALQYRIDAIEGRRVLIAPLNWGIGHATRCIPIIKRLLEAGKEVIVAADGYPLLLLQKTFPQLVCIEFKWVDIHYSKANSQVLPIMWQIPKFMYAIFREHNTLKHIVNAYGIDTIISDNRFGLWHKKVKSIYITHQIGVIVSPKNKALNYLAYLLHKNIINRYDECWIPDFEGTDNLSGDLSHKYPLPENAYFVGILSRCQ